MPRLVCSSASASVTLVSNIIVTVSPSSATVQTSQRASFAATLTNASDTAVSWLVNSDPERKSNRRTNLPVRFQSLRRANRTKFQQRRLSRACRTAHGRSCHRHRREPRRPFENRQRNRVRHGHLNSALSFRLPVLCFRSAFHEHSQHPPVFRRRHWQRQHRRHLERSIRNRRPRLRWRSLRLRRCQRRLHRTHGSAFAQRNLDHRHQPSR